MGFTLGITNCIALTSHTEGGAISVTVLRHELQIVLTCVVWVYVCMYVRVQQKRRRAAFGNRRVVYP